VRALVFTLALATSGCFSAGAVVAVEDYQSRVERYPAARVPSDSGQVDYVAVRRRGVAEPAGYLDARVRRVGAELVVAPEVGDEVHVALAEVEDVELWRGRVSFDETRATGTDALSIGLITITLVGLLALITQVGTQGVE